MRLSSASPRTTRGRCGLRARRDDDAVPGGRLRAADHLRRGSRRLRARDHLRPGEPTADVVIAWIPVNAADTVVERHPGEADLDVQPSVVARPDIEHRVVGVRDRGHDRQPKAEAVARPTRSGASRWKGCSSRSTSPAGTTGPVLATRSTARRRPPTLHVDGARPRRVVSHGVLHAGSRPGARPADGSPDMLRGLQRSAEVQAGARRRRARAPAARRRRSSARSSGSRRSIPRWPWASASSASISCSCCSALLQHVPAGRPERLRRSRAGR